ncbi:MAG: hypothetical protein AAGI28_15120 [Pseudomonadota bacterium]
MDDKVSVRFWLVGVLVFLAVTTITSTVTQGDVTLGIVDHQAAGTAARVDEIQAQWRDGGVRNLAIAAFVADLAWIWIYALGGYLAGKGFATKRTGLLRGTGLVICVAAIVFGITDYIETILQFIQMLRDAGSDWMAGVAAFMQPIKIVAFIVVFLGVILSLIIDRFRPRTAS